MSGANFSSATCPHCNVLRVLLHVLNHEKDMRRDGVRFLDENPLSVDFGILRIVPRADGRIGVFCEDEPVLEMSNISFKILRIGDWIWDLARIQADLAEQFGPVHVPEH